MQQNFTLFRVRGIRIGANWSWLFIFAFIIWTLASAEFPRMYPGLSQPSYVGMGIIAGVLFVASLLLHELGHALTALREGMEIEGITLWLFGGVAQFKGMFKSAGSEFRIAIAGPIVSAILCGIFAGVTMVLNHVSAPDQIVGVTHQIAFINGSLLAFNMIPALPLDGGRVFRSYLWYRQGDFSTATISAARTARFFAGCLIAFGVLTFIQGAGIGGLWFSFIGWFLLQAAQGEAAFARLSSTLRGLQVRDVMTPTPVFVAPTVGDVSAPAVDVPVVHPDDEVLDALMRLQGPPSHAVVVDDGQAVGTVSGPDIARAIELGQLRGRVTEPVVRSRRRTRATWIVPMVFVVAAVGLFYKPPLAVLAPGASFDVVGDIRVSGIRTDHVHGKYLLTSVAVDQPNGFGLLASVFRSRELVPISQLVPRNTSPEKFFAEQKKMFEQSELIAAGAAAKAAGMPVKLSGRGAKIIAVVPGAPGARVLAKDDVIVAIDGNPVSIAEDIGAVIRSRPAGTTFTFTIERNGRTITVKARSRTGLVQQGPAIGIATETRDLNVRLPFKVSFRQRDIGGTSAGLAYSLAIYDMIKSGDLAHGRAVAATGTIDVDGHVGPIGGVREKAVAAKAAGARIFLVPNEELSGAHGSGLETHGVGTLQDAIALLQQKA
jgi:PDZ domain-containing secreted protein/Zn-dependent protease